jgi:hypothetical protein
MSVAVVVTCQMTCRLVGFGGRVRLGVMPKKRFRSAKHSSGLSVGLFLRLRPLLDTNVDSASRKVSGMAHLAEVELEALDVAELPAVI